MAYAETTTVLVTKSKADIERMVKEKYGAVAFGIMEQNGVVSIAFHLNERSILLRMPIPDTPQAERSIWRAMLLTIKGKLESADRGIETLEEAFLANIVMPNGQTVAEHTIPRIKDHYTNGGNIPLLPAPEK